MFSDVPFYYNFLFALILWWPAYIAMLIVGIVIIILEKFFFERNKIMRRIGYVLLGIPVVNVVLALIVFASTLY